MSASPSSVVFRDRTVAAWEVEIEALSVWQNVMTYFEQLERHLLDEILVFANLIQIPAVILTGVVAWLVCRPIRGLAVAWIRRVPENHHLDWIVHHRSWVTDRLVPLITPTAWPSGSGFRSWSPSAQAGLTSSRRPPLACWS